MREKHKLDIFRRCIDYPECKEAGCKYFGSNQGIHFCKRYNTGLMILIPDDVDIHNEIKELNSKRRALIRAGRYTRDDLFEFRLKTGGL